ETYVVPADGAGQPRKITHEGANVANPRWTDDNQLQYSLNAKVPSAIFLGGSDPRPTRATGNNAMFKVAVDTPGAAPAPATAVQPGVTSADGKWIAQAKDEPRTNDAPSYA